MFPWTFKIEEGPASVELTNMKKLEGEATANNRKAKLIFLYEWDIEIEFVGEFLSENFVKFIV